MMIRVFRFNTYLNLALALGLASVAGCASDKKEKKYSKRDEASLRLHLEVNPDGSERSGPITVGRQAPFMVNVEKKAFLTEFNVARVELVDTLGGWAMAVHYDQEGGWLLEQYTTANKGRRVAVAAEFGQLRWLAAPLITQRIGDGVLLFTPDASREEAERIISGVNRVAALVRKGRK